MSAAALFHPDGDLFNPTTVRLAAVPKGQRFSAWLVNSAIVDFLRRGKTELGERYTDRVLLQSQWLAGFSRRFVQKGLKTLELIGVIKRVRAYGRRTIKITGRLRGRLPEAGKARDPQTPGTPKPKPRSPANAATPEQQAAAAAQRAAALPKPDVPDEPAMDPEAAATWDRIRGTRKKISIVPDEIRRDMDRKERDRLAAELAALDALGADARTEVQNVHRGRLIATIAGLDADLARLDE